MKAVYKFFWDCGRMGEVEGVFVAEKGEVEKAIGQDIYFGEILGKHSEVYGTLGEKDLTMISDEENVVEIIEKYGLESGYNPLYYTPEARVDF